MSWILFHNYVHHLGVPPFLETPIWTYPLKMMVSCIEKSSDSGLSVWSPQHLGLDGAAIRLTWTLVYSGWNQKRYIMSMVIGCYRYLWYSGVFTFDANGLQAVLVGDDLKDCRYIMGISLSVDLTDFDALVIIYIY